MMRLHHIAIIISSESGVEFYKHLGFEEIQRIDRGYDVIIWMEGNICTLELFLDNSRPQRVTNPEANGLRHIAFETEHLEDMREKLKEYNPEEIRQDVRRFFFVKDPDGQPIEIREYIPQSPVSNYRIED